ncbi:MAG: BatA domain-containing protein [Verrucomicrobiales bacterium]
MSFLAPLFLLGALAIAGPVIFHLVQRVTRERQKFSSLMFLQPTAPKLTHKRRFEHWLLLLLRISALILLALAFARPFFREESRKSPPANSGRRTIVLVDASASMRRAGLWEAARKQASAALRDTDPTDEVAVWTFGRGTTPLIDFAQWNGTPPDGRMALVEGRLTQVSPDWTGTHLAGALMSAAEALDDDPGKSAEIARRIVLISDMQEGSHLNALGGYEWPKGIEVVVKPVLATRRTNAGVHLAADSTDAARPSDSVRVRVSNAANSTSDQFQIGWAGETQSFMGTGQDVYVPAGQSRIATLPWPNEETPADVTGGAKLRPTRILLRGDDELFDDEMFIVPPETKRVKVLYVGTESPDDVRQPLFFLRRALPNNRNIVVSVDLASPDAPLTAESLASSSMMIVTAPLPPNQAQGLREQMIHGKTVLCPLKNADFAPSLAQLAGVDSLPLAEVKPASYAMLAEVDFRHPLFVPFADPRFSDFTKIRFWKYRRVDVAELPGARVLARFDSNDPAVIECPVGKGRLIILTSGWHPEDSQFALSTKFAPLLASLLEWTGQTAVPRVQYVVGDEVRLDSSNPATILRGVPPGSATLLRPDGTSVVVEGERFSAEHTRQPGIYALTTADSVRKVAINLDPAESQTAPMNSEDLERWAVPLRQPPAAAKTTVAREEPFTAVQTEGRQKLWRWFLVAALLFLLAECLLSGAIAVRSAGAEKAG